MKPAIIGPFKGMNNRLNDRMLPADKLRNAVNVLFDDAGRVVFSSPGKTVLYSGTGIHSYYHGLFVENGNLKILNDTTATTLLTGLGDNTVYYTTVANTIFFNNGTVKGKYNTDTGIINEWGTASPPRQPDLSEASIGGMYAGNYRIAITWRGSMGEEGGTGNSKQITVSEGGGIHLSNFPIPPAYATRVCVYVSSPDGTGLYLYREYSASIDYAHVGRLPSSGKIPTIPIETQFYKTPSPLAQIYAHFGRIYYPDGRYLYRTATRRYGLQSSNAYWTFDSEIQTVVSCPGVLYIGTLNKIHKVTNIDGDGLPLREDLQNCGSVAGSEYQDPDGISAYFMSHRGLIRATPEGLTELTYQDVAIPFFSEGRQTVIENDGTKYLLFSGTDGRQNPLANKQYNVDELARGSL